MIPARPKNEIGHCLFLDIVGYSRLSMQQQRRLVQDLRSLVRAAPEVQRAEAEGELVLRDTGDGYVLVFFHDLIAPVQCALELARSLQAYSHLPLRMGIHSGPVTRDTDITGQQNVYGEGVNMTERVMNCGDAGHILLSERSADDLRHFEDWEPYLRELGEVRVKHYVPLRLFSLVAGELGNPTPPQSVCEASSAMPVATDSDSSRQETAVAIVRETRPRSSHRATSPSELAQEQGQTSRRVVIVYKRNTQTDERLVRFLEQQFHAAGHEVFVDRHLSIGVEWAKEIEQQIYAADAVIPLLSEASLRSEMLEYEVQTAHAAAQKQSGKPVLLPVRVGYTDALPNTFALILDQLQYTLWKEPEDDTRLATELLASLENPPIVKPPIPRDKLESVGGAVPLDSQFYIPRPVDAAFLEAITRRDSIVLVKGARQMGKTSLLARGLQRARETGARVVLTDFQALNDKHLASADTFFLALATMIAAKLHLQSSPRAAWDSELGASMNMDWYLESEVLGTISEPIVWGLDEVDRLFNCHFGSEVFGLFRSWHNRRALEPDGPWARLTLAMAYATEAHLFITDLNQSPFNVGTRLTVEDFTSDQVAELNRRYSNPLRSASELTRFYRLLSGHPYLVRRGLDEMAAHPLSFEGLEAQADRDEGVFGDHLRRILVSLSKDPDLTEVVCSVLRGGSCPNAESFYRLRSAGILSGDSAQEVRLRCQLYTTYLSRHLL